MDNRPIHEILADAREVYGVFGKAQHALSIVDNALSLEPDNVEALNLKAAILYELDRDDEARSFHEQALAIEPASVEALHGLASIANDFHQYTEAIDLANRALAAAPNDPYPEFRENEDYQQRLLAEVYIEKAFALWYLGKRDDALHLLEYEGPEACPLEVESFEDEIDWLEHHHNSPDED